MVCRVIPGRQVSLPHSCIKQGQCRLRKWGGYMNCGGTLSVMNTPALPLSISLPVNSCRMGGAQRNPSVLRFAACSIARMDGFRCAPPIQRRYPNWCNARVYSLSLGCSVRDRSQWINSRFSPLAGKTCLCFSRTGAPLPYRLMVCRQRRYDTLLHNMVL